MAPSCADLVAATAGALVRRNLNRSTELVEDISGGAELALQVERYGFESQLEVVIRKDVCQLGIWTPGSHRRLAFMVVYEEVRGRPDSSGSALVIPFPSPEPRILFVSQRLRYLYSGF